LFGGWGKTLAAEKKGMGDARGGLERIRVVPACVVQGGGGTEWGGELG